MSYQNFSACYTCRSIPRKTLCLLLVNRLTPLEQIVNTGLNYSKQLALAVNGKSLAINARIIISFTK